MAQILKQKVFHDGVSMIVLKPGDTDERVPENLRATFIDEGVIERPPFVSSFVPFTPPPHDGDAPAIGDDVGEGGEGQEGDDLGGGEGDGTGDGGGESGGDDGDGGEGEEADEFGPFAPVHKGGGYYEISGPGLEHPERVRGKDEAEERARVLFKALPHDGDAPV